LHKQTDDRAQKLLDASRVAELRRCLFSAQFQKVPQNLNGNEEKISGGIRIVHSAANLVGSLRTQHLLAVVH